MRVGIYSFSFYNWITEKTQYVNVLGEDKDSAEQLVRDIYAPEIRFQEEKIKLEGIRIGKLPMILPKTNIDTEEDQRECYKANFLD